MKGPYRVLILLALLVLAAVWLLGTEPWQAAPPDPGPSAAQQTGLTAKSSASETVRAGANELREELPPDLANAEDSGLRSLLLRVLETDGTTPVPGAEVHVFYDRTIEEDPEQIKTMAASTVARVFAADAEGLVHLRAPERYSWVEGFWGDLYGWSSFQFAEPEPEGGWTLLLEPDQGFDVLAVDSGGRPIAGIPISAAFDSFQPSSQRVSVTKRRLGVTGTDGLLSIRHTQRWNVLDEDGRKPVELGLQIVGDRDSTATVDLNALPHDPVEVICPATGSIRIHVLDPFGHPWKGGYVEHTPLYGVHVAPMGSTDAEREGRYLDDFEELGPSEFLLNNVALGLSYELRVSTTNPSSWTRPVLGPTRAGQEVEVVLRPPPDSLILRGTLAGENGTLAERGLSLEAETQPAEHSGYAGMARTSEDGRFWFVLNPELRGAQLDYVDLNIESEPLTRYGGVTRVPFGKELQPGIHDLGRITVVPPPLVVSGLFVHDGRSPTVYTQLIVESLRQRSTGEEEWTRVSGLVSSYGLDGTFEVRGNAPSSPLRIMAEGNSFDRTEPIEFRLGAIDLEILLSRTGSIELEILHDPLIAPSDSSLNMKLIAEYGGAGNLSAWTYDARDTHRKLRWWSMPPGKYRLEISPWTGGRLLAAFPDIEVHSGTMTHVGPLDLRGRLTRARVRIVDGSGVNISNNTLLVRRSASGSPWSQYPGGRQDRDILLGEGSVDLLGWARDYRWAHVRGIREDTTLTLLPGFEVNLSLDGLDHLPDGVQVSAALHATGEARARLPGLDPASSSPSDFADRVLRHSVRDVDDQAVFRLPVAGRFEVRVTLRRDRSAALQDIEPGIIEVVAMDGAQQFRIRIPENSLQDALERVNR